MTLDDVAIRLEFNTIVSADSADGHADPMTTLRLFEYRCWPQGHRFEASVLAQTYGDLLVRSVRPRSERVFRMDDPVREEMKSLLTELTRSEGLRLSNGEQRELFRFALSAVLDPDCNGSKFSVGRPPACPVCGSLEMEDWVSAEPPIIFDTELPLATHDDWDELEPSSRRERIRDVVAQKHKGIPRS